MTALTKIVFSVNKNVHTKSMQGVNQEEIKVYNFCSLLMVTFIYSSSFLM